MATAARVAPARPEVEARRRRRKVRRAIRSRRITGFAARRPSEIPAAKFTVGQLLNLRQGSVVQTAMRVANDVPIRINKTLLGWGRFEVVGDRLAVRITELA